MGYNLSILRDELGDEPFRQGVEKIDLKEVLVPGKYTKEIGQAIQTYLDNFQKYYQKEYNRNVDIEEKAMAYFEKNTAGYSVNDYKNKYYNESLADLVKNVNTKERLMEYKGELIQQINPIFQDPKPSSLLDYRTAFFFPNKNLFGVNISTYIFNILVIWMMSIALYLALYFELLRKLISSFEKVNIPKKK